MVNIKDALFHPVCILKHKKYFLCLFSLFMHLTQQSDVQIKRALLIHSFFAAYFDIKTWYDSFCGQFVCVLEHPGCKQKIKCAFVCLERFFEGGKSRLFFHKIVIEVIKSRKIWGQVGLYRRSFFKCEYMHS